MACYLNFKGKYFITTSSYSSFKKGLRFYRPVSVAGFLKKKLTYFVYPVATCSKNKIQKEEFFQRNKIQELLEIEKTFGTFNAIYVPPGSGKIVIQVLDGTKISGYLKVSQWFFKRNNSLFTRIDEWAKLLFLIWFSLLVSISDSILFLAVAFTFVLVVAAISKADIKALIFSSWAFVQLVTFIISIPYMLITKSIMPAVLQVLKTGIIIMTGEVVIYNSRIDRLFKPFSFFGGLKEFIWLVELTIRNIFVLLHTITDILFAKKIRTVGVSRNRLDFVKSMIRAIAQKTIYISEVTYVSMKTRGFSSGNVKFVYRFKVTISELLVVFLFFIMSILERILK